LSMVEFQCPICNTIFSIEKRNSPLIIKSKKAACCSRKCGGKLSHNKEIVNKIIVIREWILYKYL